jgi:hypothetical protein
MIRRSTPSLLEQFDLTEFLEYQAPPIRWRARDLESALASTAVLIAEHPYLPFSIPAQSVRTQ